MNPSPLSTGRTVIFKLPFFIKMRYILIIILLVQWGFSSIQKDYFSERDDFDFPMEEPIPLDALCRAYNPALVNLEENAQDFIVTTKQIEIAGYPGAFNPSIIRWENSLLLSFRIRNPISKGTDGIGLVWLDEEFNPISEPQVLSIPYEKQPISKQQDPRLIAIGNHLFLVYNNVIDPIVHPELRRMYYVELIYDGISFSPQKPQAITKYPYQLSYRQEKNWIPFDFNNQLLLSYTIHPHIVFYPLLHTPICELFAETTTTVEWPWGTLRGGTPALKIGDEYLAFFHSCIHLPTLHSNGKNILHYFMGAYTFSAMPPFQLTRLSPHPIIGKTFYSGPAYKTWKPLRVVFPCGYVFDDKYINVVYGKQDFEMWVVQLDKYKFLESLKPLTQVRQM